MIDPTRRSVLKFLGTSALAASSGGVASAASQPGMLRLFSEQSVPGSMETVTQGHYAYVANGAGMHIVDWQNPGRPETVATVDLHDDLPNPTPNVKDVKVEGNVAALANDTEDPGGIALYDISDPTNPEFQSFYEPDPPSNIHNCHVVGNHAFLTLGEPTNIDTDGDGERDLVRIFGDAGVEIVDISNPANPTHASTWLLKDELPGYAKGAVSPCHDLYAQDGLVYCAFWDTGTIVLDVSNPTDPQFVTQFGAAPKADTEIRPWRVEEESIRDYLSNVFPTGRYLSLPGNAHYVQPSPDGDHVYVGAETFIGAPGGIDVWDVSDLTAPEKVGHIDPPDADGFRTSHNFDVTENKLHTSWYAGGVRVYDITDPTNPVEEAVYMPENVSFWTAVDARDFTVGGIYGGGVTFLHQDRGAKQPPAFSGDAPPNRPEVDPRDASE